MAHIRFFSCYLVRWMHESDACVSKKEAASRQFYEMRSFDGSSISMLPCDRKCQLLAQPPIYQLFISLLSIAVVLHN